VSHSRDHHREWTIVWAVSWEFCVNPVADTTESESYWDTHCEDISDLEESISIPLGKEKNCEENSEESPMEAHASLPDREYL
jgi:hypothetical protein